MGHAARIMLSHDKVWEAIDALAARHGLTPSGLARRSNLDPTTFNKSKRHSADGRKRWPSTESLSKVIEATGSSVDDFLSLLSDRANARSHAIPLIGLAQAGAGGYFDDAGFPEGEGWDEVEFPQGAGEGTFALEVSGDSMVPLYRDGDILLVSRSEQVRRGDRVVVRTREGEVMAKVLQRHTPKTIELKSINPAHEDRVFTAEEVDWIARIVWASQ